VVWHTTGSGKSFTMVFLTKALLLVDALAECRVVVVTDRVDLEGQLSRNFISGGAFGSAIATQKDGEKSRAMTGRDLARASAAARSASPSRWCTSSTRRPSCRSAATTRPT
jgi:type I restriction enzyme R subunit